MLYYNQLLRCNVFYNIITVVIKIVLSLLLILFVMDVQLVFRKAIIRIKHFYSINYEFYNSFGNFCYKQ